MADPSVNKRIKECLMADRVLPSRLEIYRICQERGHDPSGALLMSNPPMYRCKWCGTNYRWTEPELVEAGQPNTAVKEIIDEDQDLLDRLAET